MPNESLESLAVCNLPTQATTNFVFDDRLAGGLDFINVNIDADIQTVTDCLHAFLPRRMTPPEIITSAQLFSIVHRTIHHPPTKKETDLFLSGSMETPATAGRYLLSGPGPVQMQVS